MVALDEVCGAPSHRLRNIEAHLKCEYLVRCQLKSETDYRSLTVIIPSWRTEHLMYAEYINIINELRRCNTIGPKGVHVTKGLLLQRRFSPSQLATRSGYRGRNDPSRRNFSRRFSCFPGGFRVFYLEARGIPTALSKN